MNDVINFTKNKCIQKRTATVGYTLDDHEFVCEVTESLLESCGPIASRVKVCTYEITEGSIEEAEMLARTDVEIALYLRGLKPEEERPPESGEREFKYKLSSAPRPLEVYYDPWEPCNDDDHPN